MIHDLKQNKQDVPGVLGLCSALIIQVFSLILFIALYQEGISIALVVFEIAMKKTLNLYVWKKTSIETYVFLLESLSRGQTSLHNKFHHVFELAMKRTLDLCFGRRPKLKLYSFFSRISQLGLDELAYKISSSQLLQYLIQL